MEFQQSPLYAKYIASLKWQIITLDGVRMFHKKIPFLGGLLKIQRPEKLPEPRQLKKIIDQYRIKTIAIEPKLSENLRHYIRWVNSVSKYSRIIRSAYMLTKTIIIDLTPDEENIFRRFTEAKRRAVRKAVKNGIIVKESKNISDLVRIKNKSGGFMGFITTIGVDKFWNILAPGHAAILLAYRPNKNPESNNPNSDIVGGVLMVYWNKTAFYWVAGASREGKKLSAPTILVWECLKTAMRHGAKEFDFLGVWDERKPSEHHDWKGFTKFKEGFGGRELYYPVY